MDDRKLVVLVFLTTVLVVLVAGVAKFEVAPVFWTIPGAVLSYFGIRAQRNGNGRRNGNGAHP